MDLARRRDQDGLMRATKFRFLVQQKNWTTPAAFASAWRKACVEAARIYQDPRLANIPLSERTFSRWMLGENKGLPRPDTRRVLEHLFAIPAEELFKECGDEQQDANPDAAPGKLAKATDSISPGPGEGSLTDQRLRAAALDPLLVPHWRDLLRILSDAHNSTGPRRIHESAVRELAVIRGFRFQAAGAMRVGLLGVEARWSEFLSWTNDNLGRAGDAAFWLSCAAELAQESGDRAMATYVRMRQAQRGADRLDIAAAQALDANSGDRLPLSVRDRALYEVRRAQGEALGGNTAGFSAAIAKAVRLVDYADGAGAGDDPETIGVHCNRAYVRAHEGFGLLRLGQAGEAARHLEGVLAAWPADYPQDEQLTRAWLGLAYAAERRFEEAAAEGMRVVTMPPSGSVRALQALGQLSRFLPSDSAGTEVERFRLTCAALTARM